MTDDDAFVAAVKESPDDAVLRLVYADWLEERDDPRGRFLRLELEMVQRGEADRDYAMLQHQLSDLTAGVAAGWLLAVSRVPIMPVSESDPFPHEEFDFFEEHIRHLPEAGVAAERAGRRWEKVCVWAIFLGVVFLIEIFKLAWRSVGR